MKVQKPVSDKALRVSYVILTILCVAGMFLWSWGQARLPADGGSGKLRNFSGRGFEVRRLLTAQTPLRVGDIIVAADGYSLEEWLRGVPTAPTRQVGDTISYTIIRAGQEQVIPVTLLFISMVKALRDELAVVFPSLFTMALALFVVLQRPRDRVAQLLFITVMLNWTQAARDVIDFQFSALAHPLFFWSDVLMEHLPYWIAVPCLVHAMLTFPEKKAILRRHPWLLWGNYLLLGLLTVGGGWWGGATLAARLGASDRVSLFVIGLQVVIILGSLVHDYFTAHTPRARDQMRWLSWGTVMGVGPFMLLYTVPIALRGRPLLAYELAVLPFALLPLSFTIAIVKHQLFDIEIIINRSLVYGTLTAVLLTFYVGFTSILSRVLPALSGKTPDAAASFLTTMIIVIIFAPVKNRAQELIDRTFYRSKLNFRRLETEMSRELATTLVYTDLRYLLTQIVPQRLAITHAFLLVLDSKKRQYTASDFALPQTHPLVRHLQTTFRSVVTRDAEGELARWVTPLRSLHAEVCIPLLAGEELVGLYLFGRKLSGQFYSREEIRILTTLGHQAALAVENVRLHHHLTEQERMKRDLEIARSIQISLLPRRDPVMAGLQVIGTSIPAQEVGGDFYHYFELSDKQLGIAVGDVSGKGVAGALFMAMSVSAVRAQAPHFHNTAQLLTSLNHVLHPQMSANKMNAAVLYVIIERAESGFTLRASNAGLIAPLILWHDGEYDYLDVSGLPIGIIADARYSERQTPLASRDVIILCSDGVVEAMNAEREIFGFARLEQILNASQGRDAATIAATIQQHLAEFVGEAPQHDDITLVIVQVD